MGSMGQWLAVVCLTAGLMHHAASESRENMKALKQCLRGDRPELQHRITTWNESVLHDLLPKCAVLPATSLSESCVQI